MHTNSSSFFKFNDDSVFKLKKSQEVISHNSTFIIDGKLVIAAKLNKTEYLYDIS